FVTSGLLTRASLSHLFTTREFPGLLPPASAEGPLGPEARVAIGALGLDTNRIAFARQVHGADVMVASRGGRLGSGDALVTDCPGISLAVFTADCLPILIYDAGGNGSRPRLAAVHAGWRGTVAGVARAAVEAMAAGGDPRQFAAAIGPSIGPCCYQVDRPVIDRLEMAFPHDWRAWITPQGRDA